MSFQPPPPGTGVAQLLGLLGKAAQVATGRAMQSPAPKKGKKRITCTPCAAMAAVDAARERSKNGSLKGLPASPRRRSYDNSCDTWAPSLPGAHRALRTRGW